MNKAPQVRIAPDRAAQLDRLAVLRSRPAPPKDKIFVSAQVADELMPYVREALKRVSKTDLVNIALAQYFEVQLTIAAEVA